MPRPPGTWLLRIARLLFDESVRSRVVHATIADLQAEVREAGTSRRRRLLARWRGYRAFWALVVVAPVAFWSWPATPHTDRRATTMFSPGRPSRWLPREDTVHAARSAGEPRCSNCSTSGRATQAHQRSGR